MKIICAKTRGGCGLTFRVTQELLAAFYAAQLKGTGIDCPNPGCSKHYEPHHVDKVLEAGHRNPPPEPEPEVYDD